MKLNTIGIDLAKNTFHLVCLDPHHRPIWQKKLSRNKLPEFILQQPPSMIAMEACSGAHHWARCFHQHGHQIKLLPPQHVKAYLRGQKNDYNDALAIAEAAVHSSIKPVPVKTVEQQDQQAFHRIRKQLKSEQTRIVNQVRGLLAEYGLIIPKGIHRFNERIPELLEDAENGLTHFFRRLLDRQYQRFIRIREEIAWYDTQLKETAKTHPVIKRLLDIPGLGIVNAAILLNWLGTGEQYNRGRDASASLGLVPRQHSSGGKARLFGITKRGDASVRTSLIHGARSVVRLAKEKNDPLSRWINQLVARRGFNKAVVALANKMVRIAWVMVHRGESYQAAEVAYK